MMLYLVPRSRSLWTLGGIVETIAHVRTMDADYADYMQKKYANFLPGGKYSRSASE